MSNKTSCPIQSQILSSQDIIKDLNERIKILEKKIQTDEFSESKKLTAETELKEIKKLVNTNEELLSNLHKENRKTFIISACLVVGGFLLYGLYVIFNG